MSVKRGRKWSYLNQGMVADNVSELRIANPQQSQPISTKTKKAAVKIVPRNENQLHYIQLLQNPSKQVIIATGPAGVGKSFSACQVGIKLLQESKIEKLIITRPTVAADEDLGFLPGTIEQKMAPWVRPIYDVLLDYFYAREIESMIKEGIIEMSPIGFMRGRNFNNAFIIADEMQNSTIKQLKLILTRLNMGSKIVLTGDVNQADSPRSNGLIDFITRMDGQVLEYIEMVNFTNSDIQRQPVVKEVLSLYGE